MCISEVVRSEKGRMNTTEKRPRKLTEIHTAVKAMKRRVNERAILRLFEIEPKLQTEQVFKSYFYPRSRRLIHYLVYKYVMERKSYGLEGNS